MPAVATAYDWADLYARLEKRGGVPDASSRVVDAAHAEVHGMYVDLGEVKAAITQSGFDPPLLTITADVLNVPAGSSWLLQDAVLLVRARRVQVDGTLSVALDYRAGAHASLVVFCQELSGSIQATAVQPDEPPTSFTVNQAPGAGGVQVSLQSGTPTLTELGWSHGLGLAPSDAFVQAMRSEFLFAALLSEEHPGLAIQQLTWIKDWCGYGPELLGLFLRSSSLLALLSASAQAEANGTVFVPYLTRQVYTDLAGAFVAEAKQYEADYRSLSIESTVNERFLGLARTLLANKTYESEYTTRLLAQAKANFDNAAAAVQAAEATLSAAQLKADLIAIDFKDRGIPAWQRAEIAKAVISLGTAVITFAVGIGAMLAGAAPAGPVAAEAGIAAAKSAVEAAETGSAVASLAKKLEAVMTDLKKVGEVLKALFELSKALVAVAGDFQHAESYAEKMRAIDLRDSGAQVTATYQWQVFQQAADATLKSPIDAGIEFAPELKLAVDAIAAYGQAVAAAHVAAIAAGQRYAAVSLQQQLAAKEQSQLQAYVDSLAVGGAPDKAMMLQFYQRYVDAKSSLFSALEGYRASYYYWALAPSSVRPSIIDGVDGLATGLSDLTKVSLDTQSALEQFSPPPQPVTDLRFVIDDPAVLAELAEHGTARWVVPLDARPFRGLDRVRVTRVRVWLEGAVPTDETIDVRIQTQGNYLDRRGARSYQFTSRPLVRGFRYRVRAATGPSSSDTSDWTFQDGTRGMVVQDGAVDSEVSYAYFQPTPFAEWAVTVDGAVSLATVSRITMSFAGSAISQSI